MTSACWRAGKTRSFQTRVPSKRRGGRYNGPTTFASHGATHYQPHRLRRPCPVARPLSARARGGRIVAARREQDVSGDAGSADECVAIRRLSGAAHLLLLREVHREI